MTQLLPLPPVEADPGGVPAGGAEGDPELHPGGEDDGSERQTVGTAPHETSYGYPSENTILRPQFDGSGKQNIGILDDKGK